MRSQLASRRFCGSDNLLFRRSNDLASIFLRGCLDRASSAAPSFWGSIAYRPYFLIQLSQTRLDLCQFLPSLIAGLLRFLQRFLDGGSAVAEHSGQKLAGGPDNHRGDHSEIYDEAKPVRLLEI